MEDLEVPENNIDSKGDFPIPFGVRPKKMVETISLEDLYISLETFYLLIVGCPKNVGFSKYMAMWVAYKLFFNDDFKCLVWCENPRDKVYMINYIKEEYEYYGKSLIIDGELLYADRPNGSVVLVEDYHNYNPQIEYNEIDLMIIDKDFGDENVYQILGKVAQSANQLIIGTYDIPSSIIYSMEDAPKVLLKSDYSNEYVNKFYSRNSDSMNINQERIVLGEFENIRKK